MHKNSMGWFKGEVEEISEKERKRRKRLRKVAYKSKRLNKKGRR